jgi:HEAT repeat protein
MNETKKTPPTLVPNREQVELLAARKDLAGLRGLLDRKPDILVTSAIITAIASIKTQKATLVLAELLGHDDYYTRQQAAAALEKEQWKPGTVTQQCLYLLAKQDDDGLVRIGEPAIPILIKALDHDAVPQYGCIRGPDVEVKALVKIGKAAVMPMVKALQEGTVNARRKLAGAFNILADPRALDALEAAVNDSDGEISHLAASAVGNIHDPRATAILIKALAHRNLDTRSMAMRGLEWNKERLAVEPLLHMLDDPERVVRWKVVDTLAGIGDARAVPALVKLADNPDKDLAKRAINAVGNMGDASVVKLLGLKTRDADEFIRRAAVESLGKIKHASGVPALAVAIEDPDKFVRLAAAEALAAIGAPGTASMLDAAMNKEPVDYIKDAMHKARQKMS